MPLVNVRVFALECGWLTGPAALFLEGEPGEVRAPIPAFLVRHPKGDVLFDTGMHPAVGTDPRGRLGALADVFTAEYPADAAVTARLGAMDVDPGRLRWVVLSHLHFDHAGGLAGLPNATVVVQRREWEAGSDADGQAANSFDPADYDHGHTLRLVDGEHDLFGDGRIVCLPTHGHTPGHQSLRVRTTDGDDIVLTADACYLRETLERLRLPAVVADPEAMRRALHAIRRLGDAGAQIVFGHDAEQWRTLPGAPTPLGERATSRPAT